MNRRAGVTLIEVLVAIMITGVGLLALLTLFPLGALEMAQSFKDDRCGHCKHIAASIANTWSLRTDPQVVNGMLKPPGLPPARVGGASYPVFVDPNGYWAPVSPTLPDGQNWMAGQKPGTTPGPVPQRVTFAPFSVSTPPLPTEDPMFRVPGQYRTQQLLRWTTFLDDMSFPRDDPNGIPVGRPCIPPPGLPVIPVDRTPKYSWAYVCRIPTIVSLTAPPPIVDLTVVIYSGRALDTAGTGEKAYTATFNPGNVVTLTWGAGQPAPDVVAGGWIFDATMQPFPAHGYFYRAVSITQTGANSMDVEVQTPLRATGTGVAIVLDNVIEVFERGPT